MNIDEFHEHNWLMACELIVGRDELPFTAIASTRTNDQLIMIAPFRNDSEKGDILDVLATVFRYEFCTMYSILSETWVSRYGFNTPLPTKIPRPCNDPKRLDVLLTTTMDHHGVSRASASEIMRDPSGKAKALKEAKPFEGGIGAVMDLFRRTVDPKTAAKIITRYHANQLNIMKRTCH